MSYALRGYATSRDLSLLGAQRKGAAKAAPLKERLFRLDLKRDLRTNHDVCGIVVAGCACPIDIELRYLGPDPQTRG